ncbi:MAG: hypothetical protein QM564_04530 [Bergeyella sp.]
MESNTERLQRYEYDEYTVVTNFATYEDAVEYAEKHNGELIEVGFTDGSDNPMPDATAKLMEVKKPFRVNLPNEENYTILYSDSEGFQETAEKILERMKEQKNDVAPEDWLADQNIAHGDRIIILKNNEINTVTTRERIKFLMRGNLYELAVKVPNE